MSKGITRRQFGGALSTAIAAGTGKGCANESDQAGEWAGWGRDDGGTRYSPLDQLRRENVDQLELAWTHRCGEISDGSR